MFANDVAISAPELKEEDKQLEEWRKAPEDIGITVTR